LAGGAPEEIRTPDPQIRSLMPESIYLARFPVRAAMNLWPLASALRFALHRIQFPHQLEMPFPRLPISVFMSER